MIEFIEQLRGKPAHVRHRIAIGTAAGVSGLIFVAWIAVIVASRPFSPDQFYANAPGGSGAPAVAQDNKPSFSSLLGAVGASGGQNNTPGVTVITTQASTTVDQPQPTTLSF